jgi:hypothetical protein
MAKALDCPWAACCSCWTVDRLQRWLRTGCRGCCSRLDNKARACDAFVLHRPTVLGAISLDLFAVLFGGATALLPAFASDILHIGPAGRSSAHRARSWPGAHRPHRRYETDRPPRRTLEPRSASPQARSERPVSRMAGGALPATSCARHVLDPGYPWRSR